MPFAYYRSLSAASQRTYRRSDAVTTVPLPHAIGLRPLVALLAEALADEDRSRTRLYCQRLADGMTQRLRVPPVRVTVRSVRPRDRRSELHGLYEPAEGSTSARISLWMRTARYGRVVAFKTFLRTLLHELCHHLDYELFELPETFHTEGFFKRESSLFHQLVSDGA